MSGRWQTVLGLRLVIIAWALWPLGSGHAQTTGPLIYRRIFAPSDALDTQIRDLLPLKRDEFARRLAALQQQTSSLAAQSLVRIDQVTFRARLDGKQLTGQATCSVVAAGMDAALLPLQPCSFTIESAAWNTGDSRTAIFGADQNGKLLCLVDHSGELTLKWRQAATEASSNQQAFALQFPSAPYRRLEINAPVNVELTIDSGLILSSQPSTDEPDRRIWIMELTGNVGTRLSVFSDRQQRIAASRIFARDSTVYNVMPAAVDFEATITLDVFDQSAHSLSFTASRPINVLSVQVDGQSANFRMTTADDGQARYLFETATPLSGPDHALTIAGTAIRPAHGPWILPRVALGDSQIQEGSAQVVSPAWMRLSAHPISGCVQTGAAGAGSVKISDRYDFQLFSPSAAVEIVPSQTLPPLVEDSGTQVNIETSQVTGVYIAELTSTAANRFAVAAQISRQWVIDAVETQPLEMLADRALTSGKDGLQQLELKLARPLSATRPLRVTIRAHYRRPAANEALDAPFFQMAHFPEARGGRQLVSVQVHDPSAQLVLSDDASPHEVSAAQLSSRERSLFEDPPHALILENGDSLAGVRALLIPATPQYHADVLVRADVNRLNVLQRVTIHCQPEASAVGSVLVGLSPAPVGEVTWRLAGEVPRELPAAQEAHPVVDARNEHFFRVLLPRSQTAAFEIVGEWTKALPTESTLTLATLPEATRQQGLLEIHAPTSRVAIRAPGLQPLPFAPPDSVAAPASIATPVNNPENLLRGRYCYESGGQGQATVEFAASDSNSPGIWIEMLRLRSYFSLDGAGEHEARLIVHGGGESNLLLSLPPRATSFRLVHADGSEEHLDPSGGDRSLRIPLNPTQERSEIHLRYCSGSTVAEAWPLTRLTAPVLEPHAVVLSQSWDAILPRQFVGVPPTTHKQQISPTSVSASTSGTKSAPPPVALLAGISIFDKLLDRGHGTVSDEPGFVGWGVIQLDLPSGPEASLLVYRADSITAGAWVLALLGVSLAGWFRAQLKWIPALAALAMTLAVAANPPWSLLGAGLAAGLAAGGMCLLMGSRRDYSIGWFTRIRPVASRLGVSVSTSAAVLIAIGLSHAGAAPPAEHSAPQRRPKVVFPVDANQQPAGDYVYVEESLYQRLHQSAERGMPGLPAWLLEGAHYEFPTAPKIHGDMAAVDELRAVFDFFTFHEATAVRLPLRREQVLLLEGRARLDGHPATLTWKPDGLELSLVVPDAGKHRLELALGATARQSDEGMQVALALPPAAHSSVTLPAGAELRDAAGLRLATAQPQPILLSHQAELNLMWPAGNSGSAGKAVLEAEQYSLWRVHSGSVVLESQFRLKPIGGAVREVVVEVDPRLRSLPSQAAGASPRTTVERGAPALVRIELPEPITAETNLRLSWLWPDVSGLGQFEFPAVHLRADRFTRIWTAVSLEPGLALTKAPTPAANPTAGEFAAAFGDTESGRISAAWDSSAGQPLVVATQPTDSQPHAAESIAWSVSAATTSATLTARLTNVAKNRFVHRFHIPPQLEVKQVSLMQRGRAASIRWEQHAAELTLSLLEPPEPEQTLTLQAEFGRESSSTQFHIPQIVLRDLMRRETVVSIYRQPDVQIAVKATTDWEQLPDSRNRHELNQGRLVAAFRGDVAKAPPILVSLRPNQPRLSGKMLTRVAQADGDWNAETEVQLQITAGVLDELRLSVPAQWADRLTVTPEVDQSLEGTAGDARRRLVLRPRDAASGAWQVRLRGPLLSASDGLRAPDISIEGHPEIQRLVMLDSNAGMGQLDWTTTGLTALDDSAQQAVPAVWRGLSGNLFQVVAPRFEATARTKYDGQRLTQIHLADLQVVLHGDRRLAVTAHLTVLPTTTANSHLEFMLPPGCRLLQSLVDGLAVPHTPVGLRSWQLMSPSDILPYRLSIIYDLPLPAGNHSEITLPLAMPQVRGATVTNTLWSLEIAPLAAGDRTPLQLSGVISAGKTLKASEPAVADLIRLQSLAKTIEDLSATQGDNLPPSIVSETFTRWERLFAAIYRRLQSSVGQPTSPQRDDVRLCVETVSKIRQRWQQAGLLSLENRQADSSRTAPDENKVLGTSFIADAEQPDVVIMLSRGEDAANQPRAFTIGILAVITLLLAAAPNIAAIRAPLLAHAHFLVGIAGFTWWFIAPFGWMGLMLMLIAAWLALRSPWQSAGALK